MHRRLSLQFLMIVLGGMFISFSTPAVVNACSGGHPSALKERVASAEIIVYGRIVEIDDSQQNAVMQVIYYLAGVPGSEYILLSLNTPPSQIKNRERYQSGGCFIGVTPLQLGETIIMFLTSNFDGSYNLIGRSLGDADYYRFTGPDATTGLLVPQQSALQPGDTVTSYIGTEVSFLDFTRRIRRLAGTPPQSPLYDQSYPLLAPLLITTELGTHYILPVDGRKPLLLEGNLKLYEPRHQPACWTLNCRAWSPNGIDRAYIDESGIVELVYDKTLPGQALLFSTTSDSIAVWNQADEQLQLQIYVLPYQSSPIQVNEAQLFNAFDLALNELKPRIAAWSPDGRRLAFSDDRGVWLWDALTPAALPELLTNQPASILGFSPLGRYLVLDDGSDGQSIDLVSRSSLPKGVFSPDDRLLATLGEESKLLQLTPYYELSSDFPGLLERIQWMDSNSYYAQVCFHPENSCEVMFELVYPAFQSIGPQSRMFDVSPEAGLIATVQDDATVQIMQRNGRPFIERNLRPWLDADIADIEWLPSLFYHAAK